MPTSPSYFGDYSDEDQPTLRTVANYIADVRTLLQDKIVPYRYDDDSLLVAFNVTMLETRRVRPDLFVFNIRYNGQTQAFTQIDDTYVDIEPQFRVWVEHGIAGHALKRDQEDYQDARATAFMSMFYFGLTGKMTAPPLMGGSGPGRQ